MSPSLVAVMAHPDDIEIHIAGTLCLLKDRGWDLHFVVACRGDLGSAELSREEIARIRRAEGRAAAQLAGASYDCLEVGDLRSAYDEATKSKVVEVLRRYRADAVVTHAREDYMADHETSALLAREACFAASIPNWVTPNAPDLAPLDHIPELYYADPTGQRDWRGEVVHQPIVVDVASAIDRKEAMLACHVSQRDWLRRQHGEDNYILSMREWAAVRGRQAGLDFGEGLAQHLGHAFPKTSRLVDDLGALVRKV